MKLNVTAKFAWQKLPCRGCEENLADNQPCRLTSVAPPSNKDGTGPSAKDLLKKYGSAYLVTSISLSIVSFAICYVRQPLL